MIRLISVLATLLLPFQVLSQIGSWQQPEDWVRAEPFRSGTSSKNVKGQPGLFEDYLKAVITTKEGRIIDEIRLNLFEKDELVVSKDYKGVPGYYDVKEDDIVEFRITLSDGQDLRFVRLSADEISSNYASTGFYQILIGDAQLVKRAYKELKKAEKAGGYAAGPVVDEYVLISQYFIKPKGENLYQEVKFTKKSISKVLGTDLANQAKSLVKDNGWKWKKEPDMLQLLKLLLDSKN